MISMNVNGQTHDVDVDPEMPLLWVLREVIGLPGTKFGCGAGACGACMVHVGGRAAFSCQIAAGDLDGAEVRTIEGPRTPEMTALLSAWQELDVAQCGFCQPGQIMRAADLLANITDPTGEDIVSAMDGNLCRCATYPRIQNGIRRAAQLLKS